MPRSWVPLLLLGLSSIGGCRRQDEAAAAPRDRERIAVETTQLRRIPISPSARTSADILPRRQVMVTAETAGRVRRLGVGVGDEVRRHGLLALLDTTKAGCNLSLIKAQRDRARAALDKARRDLARAEQLARKGVASASQLESAKSSVQLAEASLRETEARIELTRSQVADGRVLAPFAATVSVRHVELGDYVVPGKPVMTLVDYTTVKVKAGLHLVQALRVKKGDRCRVAVDLEGVAPLDGEVIAVGAAADPRSRQVPVEVEVKNPDGRLRPGMIAQVTCALGKPRPTLLVPQSAVVEQFEVPYAFVVVKGRAVRRQLELGPRHGLKVAVIKGLAPGEALVTVGQESLSDGTPVRVQTSARP
jgi:RND family efflux transporter MFP subunit